jgi:Cu(I)/Ag(I) efflux system membrane protein CusA/SilA
VDQAIVMVENATHHLTAKFGKQKVHGDTRDLVIPACRTVGRPIFFSVMMILISFLPVFALKGMEGKTFHPLAFTKSFAMLGVAVLSITLVPALIPTFIKGRIRSEEESWIVRTMIDIYKPVLTWALPRWNLVLGAFAVLLILGAGLFPLNAVFGIEWKTGFLVTWAVVTALTVVFLHGWRPQLVGLLSLVFIGYWAYGFERIGVEYMPPLDEGSIMDMPITVPRASVTQSADDIKLRDEILRSFPEVEMVVGKVGRAETPTDPAPLDMIETVVNLHPKDFWPKRHIQYEVAERQTAAVLQALVDKGLVKLPRTPAPLPTAGRGLGGEGFDRKSLIDPATMNAITRLDKMLREFALQRNREFDSKLAPDLTRVLVTELVRRWQEAGRLVRPVKPEEIESLSTELASTFGPRLASGAAQEDVNHLVQKIAEKLSDAGAVEMSPALLSLKRNPVQKAIAAVGEVLGAERHTLFTEMLEFAQHERARRWTGRLSALNREIFDRAVGAYNWYCIEELQKSAEQQGLWANLGVSPQPPSDEEIVPVAPANAGEAVMPALVVGGARTANAFQSIALQHLRAELDRPFAKRLFLWQKHKSDVVKEMDSALQMPGWGNIWTQPIINRIDMLATGVRTMIGVKVFGKDLDEIQKLSEEIAAVLRTIPGAVDVFPDQNVGKGYLEIKIKRKKAARYGVSVGAIQDVIEVALGGKPITMTVEGRERHPVRIRYARDFREDEEQVKDLLVSAKGGMGVGGGAMGGSSGNMGGGTSSSMTLSGPAAPPEADSETAQPARPLQVPLKMVADVKIVEGPAMIKSENGMLRSYVQLNVRERDIVGFVEEAQRVVDQKVELPAGMYLEWSGQFEHQIRARNTLRIVWPAVMVLIFIILYMTYNDFVDAVLMMMAVPEALVGGIFFLWLRDTHFSTAVQVGFIACFGMATETGIIMLVYLREAIERRGGLEKIQSLDELREAVIEGAVHRLRPKLLTEGVAIVALAPMLWHTGVGHEVISAMAAPVLGGLLIADEVVDIFIPVRFYWVRRRRWLKLHGEERNGEPVEGRRLT